jgi:hypothetical protein
MLTSSNYVAGAALARTRLARVRSEWMDDQDFPQAASEQASALIRRATDPDRRLPGEDPAIADADDAEHWAHVYDQLLQFKERMLADLDDAEHALPEPATAETELDKQVMVIQADRLRRRRAFWEARKRNLEGA